MCNWQNVDAALNGGVTPVDEAVIADHEALKELTAFLAKVEALQLATDGSIAAWRHFWLTGRSLWLRREESTVYQERRLTPQNAPAPGQNTASVVVDHGRALAWHNDWLAWLRFGLEIVQVFPESRQSFYLSMAICRLAEEMLSPSMPDSLALPLDEVHFGLQSLTTSDPVPRARIEDLKVQIAFVLLP